jgi:hypothetical protein
MSETVYAHFTGQDHRPSVATPAATVPRLTRAQLEAAVAGHFAAGPATPDVITTLCHLVAALDGLDAKRDPDGALSPADAISFQIYAERIPPLLRRLGVYPV